MKNANQRCLLVIVMCLAGCAKDAESPGGLDELGGDSGLRRMPFLPNTYVRVTQGAESSYSHSGNLSQAIDWSAPDFEDRGLPVTAMQSGTVVDVEQGFSDATSSGFGNMVEIQTADGDIDRLAHCRNIVVGIGETVRQGQVVCLLGTSGNSTGTHVHSDTRHSGTTQTLALNFFETVGVPQEYHEYSSRNTGPYDRIYWEHGGPAMLGTPSEEARWYSPYVPCEDTDGDSDFTCDNENAHRNNVHVLHLRGGAVGRGAIVYDALRGARQAVIIHGQLYDWWLAYGGPSSELGIPVNLEYVDATGLTRQDGLGGYLTWDGVNASYHSWQDNVAPGEFADGWDVSVSYLFIEAYKALGNAPRAGEPAAQYGNPAEVHFWPGTRYLIQDFNYGELGWFIIMYDPQNVEYGGKNQAVPITGVFWEYYRGQDGPTTFGAPVQGVYEDGISGYQRMDWESGDCLLLVDGRIMRGSVSTSKNCVVEAGSGPDPDPDPESVEVCDGADNDGDGLSDEDFSCLVGSNEACLTTCGTVGTRYCGDLCQWGACAPAAGDCEEDPPESERLVISFTPTSPVVTDFIYSDWSAYQSGELIRAWGELCRATASHSIECSIEQPGASYVEFNIQYAGRWACEGVGHSVTGAVSAVWQGAAFVPTAVDNGFAGCNLRLEMP